MNSAEISISVVIGFRDWGLDRLNLSINSILESFSGFSGEVIVSDYGSVDPQPVRKVVESAGAVYLRVDTADVWSRSRALNAGLAIARGKYLACTDADMLFTPGTVPAVLRLFELDENRFFVLQCRDLPSSLDATGVQNQIDDGLDWGIIDRSSRLRPRWGMGGFIVLPRVAYESIRGLDERMEVYGGEDIDLANRLRRAGYRLEWLDDENARMYHIWHPPTRNIASKTERGSEAILRNRHIMLEDKTVLRNLDSWTFKPKDSFPPITVAIASYNRAETILDSIHSVLAQTMPDFELVVMDDGSSDGTLEILESVDDERLRVLTQENQGVAAARNSILDVSRGEYTVVHDSDDLMPPWRLRAHLENLGPQIHGNYGAAINFDDVTGEMSVIRGKKYSAPALLFNSQVLLHGTMMIATDMLRRVRYDSSLRSGTDYNLNVRLAKLGLNFVHTGELHLLRRVHEGQMTELDSGVQKLSSNLTNAVMRAQYGRNNEQYHRKNRKDDIDLSYSDDELIEAGRPYLPDHLVKRRVIANARFGVRAEDIAVAGDWVTSESLWSGELQNPMFSSVDVSWPELATLSKQFLIVKSETVSGQVSENGISLQTSIVAPFIEFARKTLNEYVNLVDDVFVGVFEHGDEPTTEHAALMAQAQLASGSRRYVCRVFAERVDAEYASAILFFRLGRRPESLSVLEPNGALS